MSKRGADWYKREPRAFLEGVRRMTEREVAVYAIVLDLIYDGGHQTLNDPKHIASYFSGLGAAAVRHAIGSLISLGKLEQDGEFLTNKRAKNQGKTREELKETRTKVGHEGGVSSAKSRAKSKKNNNIAEPIATIHVREDKIREDIDDIEPKGSLSKVRSDTAGFPEPDSFPKFWTAYPKKADRKLAEKAFAKASKRAAVSAIIAGAKSYAGQRTGQDAKYTKNATTWLNNDCWDDSASQTSFDPGRDADGNLTNDFLFGRG